MPEKPDEPAPEKAAPSAIPTPIRAAGGLVAVEGVVSLIVAVVFVVRVLVGTDSSAASGYGTAAWFGVLGAAIAAAGVALIVGRRWGRAIAVVVQVLLLPVAWALLTDSHQPVYGVVLGVVAIGTLGLLFSPPANRWMTHEYEARR